MTKRNCKRFRNNKYGCLDGLRWCGLRGNWCMSAQSDKYNRQKGQPKFLCIYTLFSAAKVCQCICAVKTSEGASIGVVEQYGGINNASRAVPQQGPDILLTLTA